MNWLAIMVGLGGAAIALTGDVLLKYHATHPRVILFAGGMVFYALAAIPALYLFKNIQFGQVFLVWQTATILLSGLVSILWFRDPATATRLAAILLAVGAIYLSYQD